jgi:anti-sigma factor RsiW
VIACSALDDYLAGSLVGDELEEFSAHLLACSECRAAVADHERLAASLSAAVDLQPLPAGLTDRVHSRIRIACRRRVIAATGALAAAVAAAIWLFGKPADRPLPPMAPPEVVASRPAESVRVTFPPGQVIAIREPMQSPNVTFVWVYPNLRGTSPPDSERNEQ